MNDNIITFNIPNAITIVIMAAVGAAVLSLIKKAMTGRPIASQTRVPGT